MRREVNEQNGRWRELSERVDGLERRHRHFWLGELLVFLAAFVLADILYDVLKALL